jgi:hypothetical protein
LRQVSYVIQQRFSRHCQAVAGSLLVFTVKVFVISGVTAQW